MENFIRITKENLEWLATQLLDKDCIQVKVDQFFLNTSNENLLIIKAPIKIKE